jgi:outer membrane protein TolC
MSLKYTLFCFACFACILDTSYGQKSVASTSTSQVEVPVITVNDDPSIDLESQLPPLENLIEIAINNSPYLKYDSVLITSGEMDVTLAKRRWQNNVSGFANYAAGNQRFFINNVGSSDQQGNVINGYRYGVNVTLPLSEITTRRLRINKEKAQLQTLGFKKDQTEMELRRQVIVEYNNLIAAQRILKIRTSARENALVVQQMADKQFKEGTTSLEDYSNVSYLTVGAESDYELARSNFSALYKQFEELVGVDISNLIKKK